MTDAIHTDAAIGETRQILTRDGRVVALSVWRWSDTGRRAQWGETYAARVRSIDQRRRGAFLDLGIAEQGFVRLSAKAEALVQGALIRLAEGQGVTAVVKREGVREKSPVLEIVASDSAERPRRLSRHDSLETDEHAAPATAEVREQIDAAIEMALAPRAPIPDGGVLIIEPTAALVAIDVDAGGRAGPVDAERFAAALNVAAAGEAARQLRLRSLGGLVAVDFISMRAQASRLAVMEALKAAAAGDPWRLRIAPMSRFGVVEMSRGQLRAPLVETLCDADGTPSAETAALAALRGIEREAARARGRPVVAHVAQDVAAWLDADVIAWRAALTARVGPLWEVRADPRAAPRSWQVEVR